MKTSFASLVIALVYFLSFVAADHLSNMVMTSSPDDQTKVTTSGLGADLGVVTNTIDAKSNNIVVSNSKISLSKDDRVQLAQTIKEMMANSPDAGPAGEMSVEDLFGFLSRVATVATTPGVLSNAAGIISAARSGNTAALAGHVTDLLGAAIPAALPAPALAPAPVSPPVSPMLPPTMPVAAPVVTRAAPVVPIAPIYATTARVAALPSMSA
ncbi:hypothetical protein PInf_024204 [Phytophthora infestans]|nr:hypothetical protein PInf_024204 [Phytophthora infestans]